MARPKRITLTPSAVDANSVFEDQTTGGAGNITLDGTDVSGGVWTSPDGLAHQIGIECAGDINTVTFTITGFEDAAKHKAITDTITGVNASTVESTKYFAVITQIAVDGAVGTNTEGGFVDEFISQDIPVNHYRSEIGLNAIVTGTINYTIQQTFDDIQSATAPFNYIDHDDTDVVLSTTNQNANYDKPPVATRIKVNSYSSGATLTYNITQANN